MVYKVTFDTQRNRQYISWEWYTRGARSQKEAKELARNAWEERKHGTHISHMFHVEAKRVDAVDLNWFKQIEYGKFKIVKQRYATWG